jgi:hypothetical protein
VFDIEFAWVDDHCDLPFLGDDLCAEEMRGVDVVTQIFAQGLGEKDRRLHRAMVDGNVG